MRRLTILFVILSIVSFNAIAEDNYVYFHKDIGTIHAGSCLPFSCLYVRITSVTDTTEKNKEGGIVKDVFFPIKKYSQEKNSILFKDRKQDRRGSPNQTGFDFDVYINKKVKVDELSSLKVVNNSEINIDYYAQCIKPMLDNAKYYLKKDSIIFDQIGDNYRYYFESSPKEVHNLKEGIKVNGRPVFIVMASDTSTKTYIPDFPVEVAYFPTVFPTVDDKGNENNGSIRQFIDHYPNLFGWIVAIGSLLIISILILILVLVCFLNKYHEETQSPQKESTTKPKDDTANDSKKNVVCKEKNVSTIKSVCLFFKLKRRVLKELKEWKELRKQTEQIINGLTIDNGNGDTCTIASAVSSLKDELGVIAKGLKIDKEKGTSELHTDLQSVRDQIGGITDDLTIDNDGNKCTIASAVSSLQTELEQLKTQTKGITDQLTIGKENATIASAVSSLKDELGVIAKGLKIDKEKDTSGLHTDLQSVREQIGKITKELIIDNEDKGTCTIASEVSSLKDELRQLKNQTNEQNTEIRKVVDSINGKMGAIEQEKSEAMIRMQADNARKDTELTNAQNQLQSLENELDTAKDEIKQFKDSIEKSGAIQISGYQKFLSFGKNIMDSCSKGEEICTRYYSRLKPEVKSKLEYFFSNYYLRKPESEILRWSNILGLLDYNGSLKAPEYTKYMDTKSDAEKISFLWKLFFENLVRPYVSSVLVLLEQMRTSDAFGTDDIGTSDFIKAINEIQTLCKGDQITVDYRRLFEPVTTYDTLVIKDSSVIPPSLAGSIDLEKKKVLLFVQNFAVNSKISEETEKTVCYINL